MHVCVSVKNHLQALKAIILFLSMQQHQLNANDENLMKSSFIHIFPSRLIHFASFNVEMNVDYFTVYFIISTCM